jgi:hypothetical protein
VTVEKLWIPEGVVRASIHKPLQSQYVTVTSTSIAAPQPILAPACTTPAYRHLGAAAPQHPRHGEAIATAIKAHKAIAVSDGGLKFGLGTAAYIIEGEMGRIKGANKVPGPIKEGDSHRCKALGLYAIILLVKEICATHQVWEGSVTICCDNTRALDIFDPEYLLDPQLPNLDLEGARWALKNKVPIIWNTERVKGHQDRIAPIYTLLQKARINAEVNQAATAYWIHLVSQSRRMPCPEMIEVYGEEWQL